MYLLFYIIIGLLFCSIAYLLILIRIRNSDEKSYWKHLGESLFAPMSRSYNRISDGLRNIYTPLVEKGYNNPLGFFGGAACTIALFLLLIIDISFISLMGAQFWGSDPEKLTSEIQEASNTSVTINSFTDYFDSILNWGVSHVAVEPGGHFLAANAIITVICLLIFGMFLKESCKPIGLLPLNLKTTGRWIIGSLSFILISCIVFYYGFLIYYGVYSTDAMGTESTELVDYFSSTEMTDSESTTASLLESFRSGKLAASVSYSIAVLGANFLAFWGTFLMYGIIITFIIFLLRSLLELVYNCTILPLGIAMGYVQIQNPSQNIALHQRETENQPQGIPAQIEANNNDLPISVEYSGERSDEQVDQANEVQQLRTELDEYRIAEEERQRAIYNNPLNLNK